MWAFLAFYNCHVFAFSFPFLSFPFGYTLFGKYKELMFSFELSNERIQDHTFETHNA